MKKKTPSTPHYLKISRASASGMLIGFKSRGGGFQMVNRNGNADEEIAEGVETWEERKRR